MAFSLSRTESPQAFVSSFATCVRIPELAADTGHPNAIPPLRWRGTTAIRYSEDFENDGLVRMATPEDPPARSLRQNESQTVVTTGPVSQPN